MISKKPLVLIILDGWGHLETSEWNAIQQARTPHWNHWWQVYPHQLLQASGPYVGLPESQMGNSEVGHSHMGAGRIIHQDLTRINQAIATHTFVTNPTFVQLLKTVTSTHKTLHVMGLLSDGGVHSHEDHLHDFLKLAHTMHCSSLRLHLFLDGRDTSPQSALDSIAKLQHYLHTYPGAKIASITGRYFAMDRDTRWERTAAAYNLLTSPSEEPIFPDAAAAITAYYQQGITDEFIPPTLIGKPQPLVDGDAIFYFNFRADRARQLTEAFVNPQFKGFARHTTPRLSHFVSMTRYADNLDTEVAFPPTILHNTLGEVIANHGLHQLRIAETEKFAHVTYFFNGGSEHVFAHEERVLIPSPRVATYDLQPEMSARALTQALQEAIQQATFDIIICNYANADMVGHSGDFSATVAAIECIDSCLNAVWNTLETHNGHMVITADHGNAEIMFDEATGQAHTAHTCQPVPFLYLGQGWQIADATCGSLVDIAPTLLTLLGLKIPAEMTGHSLLVPQS